MTTGILHDQNLEKQMGCMTGFLQLFDRNQILTGKRLYTTKRLPPSPPADSASQSEKSIGSPAFSGELQKAPARSLPEYTKHSASPGILSPTPENANPPDVQARMPSPLPVFESKEGMRSMWKLKEAPRLSLDSRAVMDGKGSLYPREIRTNASTLLSGNRSANCAAAADEDENEKQRRSPSVIARLMGLEALPDSCRAPIKKAELRRSASESRVSRDLLQYRHTDENSYQMVQPYLQSNFEGKIPSYNVARDNTVAENQRLRSRTPDLTEYCVGKQNSQQPKGCSAASPWKSSQQRKSFYDTQDIFPEPKQAGSLYGEIEKRLKMRGIDEPAKDLETLKQILEALQLKGLLHSKKPTEQITNHRNLAFDQSFLSEDSPIVIMKPSRSTVSINRIDIRRAESPSNPRSTRPVVVHRNLDFSGPSIPPVRPRRDRTTEIDRSSQREKVTARTSRDRNDSNDRSPSSLARRRPSNVETQRRANANDCAEQRRSSPTQSPKTMSSRKSGSDQTTSSGSPRPKRSSTAEISPKERISTTSSAAAAEDEISSTISENSRSTSSQMDAELQGSRMEYYKEGKSLLERCDKLLNSIAEITSTTTELQPSPVSVLDPSFYKDESSSPSPVMKRCIHFIDFKDQSADLEEENWSPAISPLKFKSGDESSDCDFIYISEILQANDFVSEESDVFSLLEKQQYKHSSSKASRLHRRLVFDTVTEILDRKKQLPPWKTFSGVKPSFRQIWSEFQRIREKADDAVEDLFEAICGVLRKDMAGDRAAGWGEWPAETSDAVLDIERLIFKDMVAETIRDLAAIAGKSKTLAPPRRKLVF